MNKQQWEHKAEKVRLETRPLIDGEFVASRSSKRYTKINPASEEALVDAYEGSPDDVDTAVKSGRRAFTDGRWARIAPQERRDHLLRLVQLLIEHREELALLDSLDVGKPISQALSEVEMACGYLRFAAEASDKVLDDVLPSHPALLALNVREPVGVVGAILPWNFPVVAVALKIAPALAAGNSVVLKPSELSPLSALRIGQLALEAGVPDGALNVVPGVGATVGRTIAQHNDIDMLTFTGSSATGGMLLQSAGESNLKKLLLECGGKSPHIVFSDAGDLDVVAADVVEQITWNQGQVCIAGSRLLVEASIHADLLKRVIHLMAAISPGDPLDPATTYGPLVSGEHLKKVLGYVEAAKESGAQLRVGGRRADRRGYFMEATVFDGVRVNHPVACEEIFGPVMAVMPFSTREEALSIAHSVNYGLSARIWTRDVAKGYALARQLRAGEVTVNAAPVTQPGVGPAASTEPFGRSGFGVEGGLEGLRQYTRCKAIHINLPAERTR